jgi:hypothetical protein
VGHASTSGGLLHMEAGRAKVFMSDLKTDRCTTAGGACGIITEVAWSSSRRRMGRCNGLRRTLLPLLCQFLYIRPYVYSSLLVFYLDL